MGATATRDEGRGRLAEADGHRTRLGGGGGRWARRAARRRQRQMGWAVGLMRKLFFARASSALPLARQQQPSPADTQSNRWPWRRANHTRLPPHHRASLVLWLRAGAGLRLPHCGARRPAARPVTCSLSPSLYLNRRRRRLSASAARADGSSANCFPWAPSLASYRFLFPSSGSGAAAHLQALVPKLHY